MIADRVPLDDWPDEDLTELCAMALPPKRTFVRADDSCLEFLAWQWRRGDFMADGGPAPAPADEDLVYGDPPEGAE